MPLSQEAQLLNDSALQQRVVMAVLHIASDVINEDAATPEHESRANLAAACMRDPQTYARQMYFYIVIQPGIVEHGGNSSEILDQTILDTVSGLWNTFATEVFPPATPAPPPIAFMNPPTAPLAPGPMLPAPGAPKMN